MGRERRGEGKGGEQGRGGRRGEVSRGEGMGRGWGWGEGREARERSCALVEFPVGGVEQLLVPQAEGARLHLAVAEARRDLTREEVLVLQPVVLVQHRAHVRPHAARLGDAVGHLLDLVLESALCHLLLRLLLLRLVAEHVRGVPLLLVPLLVRVAVLRLGACNHLGEGRVLRRLGVVLVVEHGAHLRVPLGRVEVLVHVELPRVRAARDLLDLLEAAQDLVSLEGLIINSNNSNNSNHHHHHHHHSNHNHNYNHNSNTHSNTLSRCSSCFFSSSCSALRTARASSAPLRSSFFGSRRTESATLRGLAATRSAPFSSKRKFILRSKSASRSSKASSSPSSPSLPCAASWRAGAARPPGPGGGLGPSTRALGRPPRGSRSSSLSPAPSSGARHSCLVTYSRRKRSSCVSLASGSSR
ncbi:hypothetical protein T492DRAFT_403294 [Pavlovales sp. CCMP2436]|nr:hypothetical protein T492DRAFT_403294 [Pavlovales sp. CCMP2436]